MSSATRRIDDDSSTSEGESGVSAGGSAVRGLAVAAVLTGVGAALAATLLPVLRVTVAGRVQPALDRSGWDLHGPLLLGLAIVAALLLPAALRGWAAAAAGIAGTGVVILVIAAVTDLPDVGERGLIGGSLAEGVGGAGPGAYAELLAGVMLLLAGGILLLGSERD